MQKIVIIGGPGTGKTTIIQELSKKGYSCMPEISRQVTKMARKNGIEQLFLKDPMLFSKLLLEGRINQYKEASHKKTDYVFFDRGIPDVHAYMNYMGIKYPDIYIKESLHNMYDAVFIMPPWKDIYINDEERYESFEQSLAIHNHLYNTYTSIGYKPVEVPFGNVMKRVDFILNKLSK